jgi:hypothetical protein
VLAVGFSTIPVGFSTIPVEFSVITVEFSAFSAASGAMAVIFEPNRAEIEPLWPESCFFAAGLALFFGFGLRGGLNNICESGNQKKKKKKKKKKKTHFFFPPKKKNRRKSPKKACKGRQRFGKIKQKVNLNDFLLRYS